MEDKTSICTVRRYSGCLLHCKDLKQGHELVLLGRKSFGDRRITNVGGGMLDEGEHWLPGALRELGEETFELLRTIVVEMVGRERMGARVHSRLYNVTIAGKLPDVAVFNAKASEALALLTKLKVDPHGISADKLHEIKRTTEFDRFYWVPLDGLLNAAQAYYQASDQGTKSAQPVEMEGVGVLEPSFCCLLASELKKLQ